MDNKLTLQDIINSFCKNKNISKKDGDIFIKALFETISEALIDDGFVKIKGLGTFKIIIINDRESIDINTRERIQIESHPRITFTPDNYLKKLINKPFEHFESIPLSENVTDEDLKIVDNLDNNDNHTIKREEKKESIELSSINENKTDSSLISSPPYNKEIIVETITKTIAQEISKEIIKNISLTIEQKTIEYQSSLSQKNKNYFFRYFLASFFILTLIIGAFFIGLYINSSYSLKNTIKTTPIKSETINLKKYLRKQTLKNKKDSIQNTKDTLIKNTYNPQLHYKIIGLKTIHTFRKGDNIAKLAQEVYGSKDFSNYIIKYNNLQDPNLIHVGDKIKLPELKEKEN